MTECYKRKVLVVEDDPMVRKLIRIVLQRAGLAVVEASNGREATAQLNDEIGALVAAIDIPGMNGLELVRQTRQRKPELAVLIVSSGVTEHDDESEQVSVLGKAV